MDDIALKYLAEWRSDWCAFASDVLRANLDEEQKAVLRSVQKNPMTAVASGTSRGILWQLVLPYALCILRPNGTTTAI